VVALLRRLSFAGFLSLLAVSPLLASSNWTQPTPEELKMTSDPAAPDAPAVFLFREETVDDKLHYHRLYARVKILSEKGKQQYGDIEIPYEAGATSIHAIEGRTIHADGTVIPFTGKPYEKELVKHGDTKIMAKVFSMPDVQVGSILEYRWEMGYADDYVIPPSWDIQQDLFVHKAHYHFVPSESHYLTHRDSRGHESPVNRLLYYHDLPAGAAVVEGFGGYDLVVQNVPAIPEEEFSPPMDSFGYRLFFYYSPSNSGEDFWKREGRNWSKEVDRFANPSDAIRQAVAKIVAPGDTDEQKLQKIYAAVMTVENTRFTRQHSAAENKAEGLRVKTAADVWEQKRGTDDEITRLFIAFARAAGFKAYAMITTERDRALLNTGVLNWGQLEDEAAIVEVGGKEMFFDPGQRYCAFGHLHWMHTQIPAIRQTDKEIAVIMTPAQQYTDNKIVRFADLALSADGTVQGQLRITMSGDQALRWRQKALRTDEQETKKEFEDELQTVVPDGVRVKTDHFLALNNPESVLMAIVNVSGNLGTVTGKRVFLPGAFFEARQRPLFASQKRESMVDLHYPYETQDAVTFTLAPGLTVENLPKNMDIPLPKIAAYKSAAGMKGNVYEQVRTMALGSPVVPKEDYPRLRDFFQKAGAADRQPVVLTRTAVAAVATHTGNSE
jgi:hypothetical protein